MDDNRIQSFNAIILNFFFYFFAVKTCRSYFNFQSINGIKEEIGGLKEKVIKIRFLFSIPGRRKKKEKTFIEDLQCKKNEKKFCVSLP